MVDLDNKSGSKSEDTHLMEANARTSLLHRSQSNTEKDYSGFKLFRSLSGRRKYTLILITTATFLEGVAFSLLGPFYPSEAVRKGMSLTVVGFVFGIFELIIFLTAPIYGSNLVRLGPRFVFLAGIFIGGSCVILFGTLEHCPNGTPFIVMSVVIRSVEALGFSGFITSSFAIVSSEFKENVGFTFGIVEMGAGLGFMLGPTIGGAFYVLGGFGLPFYFAGSLALLNGLAVYKFLPPVEDHPKKRRGSMLTLLRSPAMVIPLMCVTVGVIGITSFDSTLARHLKPMHFTVGEIGVVFGLVAFLYSVLSTVWGYVSDTKNIQAPLIVVGHLVFGLGFLLIGPTGLLPFLPFNLATLLSGLACIGASFGCLVIPPMKCMVNGAMELGFENNLDTYALVSGLFNAMHNLGGFIGPVGVGYVIQTYGYSVGYTVIGLVSVFMMVVSLVFFTLRRLKRTRNGTTASGVSGNEEEAVDDSSTMPISYLRGRSLSMSM